MDNSREDFWVQYYDGSAWRTVATYARTTDFNNGVFYNKIVTISSSQYNFPINARLRFMCDASGNQDDVYIDEIEFRGAGGVAKLAGSEPLVPDEFALYQNYPNPFNPTTIIGFALPYSSNIELEIFNIMGQRVTTLANGTYEAGVHSVEWHGVDTNGRTVASGMYFYRLRTDRDVETRKMLLLK